MGDRSFDRPYTVALIVPTGIGATIGGYAGDALPIARAISAIADVTITHPNVLNGAQLYWPMDSTLYVEGYGLDQVAAGRWALRPVHQNPITLILDAGIEPNLWLRQLQAANAARATLGLDLTPYLVTDQPLGVSLSRSPSGASWGTVENLDSLLRAANTAISELGAGAIAVVARFPDEETAADQAYRSGNGVDPIAGAEAILSHAVVREFRIPCAHAPALAPWDLSPDVVPRAAAEELGYTFLNCVLAGLSRAPQFVDISTGEGSRRPGDIAAGEVDAVIVPESACGGAAVLHWSGTGAKIITVADNATQMQAFPKTLNLSVWSARSYLEALGLLAAHRGGINPFHLQPSLSPLVAHQSSPAHTAPPNV
ncbi:MAG: DUF3326 domain-containing protein [Cyanobacteria bacterium P01_C01_bin.89]